MPWLWIAVFIAAVVDTTIHEAAHVLTAKHFGGQWRGIRWRRGRISSVIDMAGLSVSNHQCVAIAGVLTDFIMAVIAAAMMTHFQWHWAQGPFVWASVSVLINGCPIIPRSDGWQIIFGAKHFANSQG